MPRLLTFLALFTGIICCPAFEFRNGDLIFLGEGTSAFSDAISSATSRGDSVSFIHVGIIRVCEKEVTVIEADPEEGVREVPLAIFTHADGNRHPMISVRRLSIEFPVNESLDRALAHIGEPYDWYYLPENGMMYCSELIYESFRDENGNPIFTAAPMNFRNPDGTMPEFWTSLYEKLGVGVPEGIPGTNPNDLAKDPRLREVYRQ